MIFPNREIVKAYFERNVIYFLTEVRKVCAVGIQVWFVIE